MDAASRLLDPELLARFAKSRLQVRWPVDGTLAGVHRSLHHGSSVEFAEHKEYSPGDDVRHIDWKVYGRSDRFYVRRFEDETNLRATFVVDCSGSMAFQGSDAPGSKLDFAARFVAHLGYLLLRQQDAVGLVPVSDAVYGDLPPRARSAHVLDLCRRLEALTPAGTTALEEGLRRVAETNHKRGLVYVLSDFFAPLDSLFRLARQLRAHRYQVAFVQVLDEEELSFPFKQLTLFRAMESSARLLAEPRAIRAAYLRAMESFLARLAAGCREAGIFHQRLTSASDLREALTPHLHGGPGAAAGGRR